MADHNCANCAFRAKYDNNSGSFLGKVWRWHINWCPGWNSYMKSLSKEDRLTLAQQYTIKKYL